MLKHSRERVQIRYFLKSSRQETTLRFSLHELFASLPILARGYEQLEDNLQKQTPAPTARVFVL